MSAQPPQGFDEDRAGRYLAGDASADERSQLENEAVASDALSEELYAQTSLQGALRGEIAPVRTRRGGPGRWLM